MNKTSTITGIKTTKTDTFSLQFQPLLDQFLGRSLQLTPFPYIYEF